MIYEYLHVLDLKKSFNFAGLVIWTLDDIPKIITIQEQQYYLHGIIAFNRPEKTKSRNPSGHYTSKSNCYRSNYTIVMIT